MLPDGAHNVEEDSNLFLLKKREVQQAILDDDNLDNIDAAVAKMSQQVSIQQERDSDADVYYCLNVIKQKRFQGVRRKARVKSLAVASKYPYALNLRVCFEDLLL